MVKRSREAVTPEGIVEILLSTSRDHILVGGQALAYWVRVYDIALPARLAAISHDVDFLTTSSADIQGVKRYARALGGKTLMPSKHALTSLVGQAYLELSEDEHINVDVIWRLIGVDAARVEKRAVTVTMDTVHFRVMSPLDVLRSRLHNLHELPDKQNEKGEMQLRLAIDVSRAFVREEAARYVDALASGRSPIQGLVSEIEKLAMDDAGRKVASRHGVHVADAVDPSLIPAGPFWSRRWPTLKRLMSPEYASRFKPPRGPSS